jgi:hypothetical protein
MMRVRDQFIAVLLEALTPAGTESKLASPLRLLGIGGDRHHARGALEASESARIFGVQTATLRMQQVLHEPQLRHDALDVLLRSLAVRRTFPECLLASLCLLSTAASSGRR